MYKVFFYRFDASCACGIRIVDMKKFSSLGEALSSVSFDDDLFEITIDVPCFGGYDVTCLKNVARSASMRAYYNSYFSRFYHV